MFKCVCHSDFQTFFLIHLEVQYVKEIKEKPAVLKGSRDTQFSGLLKDHSDAYSIFLTSPWVNEEKMYSYSHIFIPLYKNLKIHMYICMHITYLINCVT